MYTTHNDKYLIVRNDEEVLATVFEGRFWRPLLETAFGDKSMQAHKLSLHNLTAISEQMKLKTN